MFIFQTFLQKLGGMPPRPPLKLLVTSEITLKSLAGLKYVRKISRKVGKNMSKFIHEQLFFSNISSKDTPLAVTCDTSKKTSVFSRLKIFKQNLKESWKKHSKFVH